MVVNKIKYTEEHQENKITQTLEFNDKIYKNDIIIHNSEIYNQHKLTTGLQQDLNCGYIMFHSIMNSIQALEFVENGWQGKNNTIKDLTEYEKLIK